MTPLQFAIAECANHQPDGSCAGVMINRDLTMSRASPKPRCLLADGKRCQYFDQCVAPMAGWVTDPRRAAGLQAAVAEYRQMTNQKAAAARPCPGCGAPLPKGKRYCQACAAARRKASNRAAQGRRRQSVVTRSAEVPENRTKSPMIPRGIFAVLRSQIEDSHPPQNGHTSADLEARRAS